MKVQNKAFTLTGDYFYVEYEQITECPKCKKAITPKFLYAYMVPENSSEDTMKLSVLEYCAGCNSVILNEYLQESNDLYFDILNHSVPNMFKEKIFDEKIKNLSEQFTKVYNQALSAETMQLDEIAGLGYRKATEFLVKDFVIHNHPDKKDDIKKFAISKCIKTYIENNDIKLLAERIAWLGNDEAHYVRKHTDRDITDMKTFIKALLHYINMELIMEDASTMPHR